MEFLFSHPRLRKHQDRFARDVFQCVKDGKHLLAHAPTGIGKTAAVLGPALTWALENDGTVFFLTPKISQHSIACQELRKISTRNNVSFTAVDIIGRKYSCVDDSLLGLDMDEFYEICARRRKNETCPYYANARGFTKTQREIAKAHLQKLLEDYKIVMEAPKLIKKCKNFEYGGEPTPLCAYEVMTQICPRSKVIIADYFHLLAPSIRESFLTKIKKDLSKSIAIIDEAHNVPNRVRNHLSVSITHLLVKKAEKEIRLFEDRTLQRAIRSVERALKEILGKKLGTQRETIIYKDDLPSFPEDTIDEFRDAGLAYLEATNRNKSACLKISKFFGLWGKDMPSYVRIAKKWKSGNGITVSYKNLDPSLATQPLIEEARSVIAMSGTLVPIQMYRDLLGFSPERTLCRVYDSPFPRRNRLNLVYTGVTTRFSRRNQQEYERIGGLVSQIISSIPGNVAVFFPSYDVIHGVRGFIKTDRQVLVQKESSTPEETNAILGLFKRMKKDGAVLLGVAGGSLAEGVDYPGRELLGVIVVGIPLNEYDLETKALIDYYEYKFGAGWTYGYLYPAMARAIQAAGRLIRNEDDVGVAVFLDERYKWKNYKRCFPPEMEVMYSQDPARDVRMFFEGRK